MRRVALALIVGALALGLAACSSGGGTGGLIEGTTWKLTSQLVDGKTVTIPGGVMADARFADGKVAGSGGCNVFTGPATVSGSKLTVGTLASTKMACEGDKASTETAYLANLAAAATFTATAEALTIYNGSGAVVLTYAAGPANPLVGEWIVTGYNNGSEAVVSPLQGTELTAVFTGDAASGNAGCNTYNGGYTLDGDQVAVGPLMTTMMACEDAIMAQEQQFLTALQVPATVEVSGGNVTLRDAAGAMQVTLAPKQ